MNATKHIYPTRKKLKNIILESKKYGQQKRSGLQDLKRSRYFRLCRVLASQGYKFPLHRVQNL